jgi:uncharacterized protein YqgC (DUF456 family)
MVRSTGKKIAGVILIVIGFAALITPFTPGSWLAFVGLELLGFRLAAKDQVMAWLGKKPTEKPPEA